MPSAHVEIALEWCVALVIAASVASTWRGGWAILDACFVPQHPVWSAILSAMIGAFGLVALCVVQSSLAAWARAHSGLRVLWAADALYTYLSMLACVFFWRGVWQLWDHSFGVGLPPSAVNASLAWGGLVSHSAGLVVLLALGAMRNLAAAPMLISSDAVGPIFGAGATAGIGWLNAFKRLRSPPPVQSAEDWHKAVGLPYQQDGAPPGAEETSRSEP